MVAMVIFLSLASSEEDDEDIFSDDHIGSDTESGDNEQVCIEVLYTLMGLHIL